MMRAFYVCTLCLLLWSSICEAQLASYFSSEDAADIEKRSLATLKAPVSSKDFYFATKILSASKTKYTCDCKVIAAFLKEQPSSYEIFYGVSSSQACGCDSSTVGKNIQAKVSSDLQDGNVLKLSGAALAAKVLGISGGETAVEQLKDLINPDGTFRLDPESDVSSVVNAKLALNAIAAYTNDIGAEIADSLLQLLPTGDDDVAVDPTLLGVLGKVAKKPKLNGARLTAIAEGLLSLKYSSDLETLAGVIESLQYLSTYKIAPILIRLKNTKIREGDKTKVINIDVLDIYGKPASIDSLEAKSVKRVGRDTAVVESKALTGSSLDLSDIEQLAPGRYVLELAATVNGRTKPVTQELFFAVQASLEVSSVYAGVSETKQASSYDLTAVATQNELSDVTASAVSGDVFHVQFALSSSSKSAKRFQKPHQVFVKFTHIESGSDSFFVAASDGALSEGLGSKFKVAVLLGQELATFSQLSGDYSISIVAADVAYAAPIEWVVGSASITFPPKVVKDHPLYAKSLLHASDVTLAPLPEISHQMRPPAKRASLFLSTTFTALTIVPLAALVVFILSLKPNLNRLQSLSSILFVGAIATVLLIYASYWLSLSGFSFYETIKYICILTPVVAVIGHYALASVTEVRRAEKQA